MSLFFWMAKESADALCEWMLKDTTPVWTSITTRVPNPAPGYDFVSRKRRKGKRK